LEEANEQYNSQGEDEETIEPEALREAFPPCTKMEELNIADVLVTCNFLFRDA
jgi:ATP-dependent DNA helicase 2 subunit 1